MHPCTCSCRDHTPQSCSEPHRTEVATGPPLSAACAGGMCQSNARTGPATAAQGFDLWRASGLSDQTHLPAKLTVCSGIIQHLCIQLGADLSQSCWLTCCRQPAFTSTCSAKSTLQFADSLLNRVLLSTCACRCPSCAMPVHSACALRLHLGTHSALVWLAQRICANGQQQVVALLQAVCCKVLVVQQGLHCPAHFCPALLLAMRVTLALPPSAGTLARIPCLRACS